MSVGCHWVGCKCLCGYIAIRKGLQPLQLVGEHLTSRSLLRACSIWTPLPCDENHIQQKGARLEERRVRGP